MFFAHVDTLMLARAAVASALLAGAVSAHGSDLLDVYRESLKTDPVLRGQAHVNRSVAEDRRQAYGSLLPTFGFDLQRTYARQDVVSSDNLVFEVGQANFPTTNWTLRLNQPLLRLDLTSELRRAEAEERAADVEYARVKQALIIRVSTLYFGVLTAADNLEFTLKEREAVDRNASLVETRLASGLANITDHHDAQARKALVRSDEVRARQELKDARQALAEVLGRRPDALDGLRDRIDLVSPEPADSTEWVTTSLAQNLEIAVQNYQVEAAREEIETARTGHYPRMDMVARYNRNDSGGSLFGGGSEVDTFDFSVQLNMPFYQGGRVSSQVRQAVENLGKAQEDRDLARRSVERQVNDSYEGVLSNISRIEALEALVEAQASALEARTEGYRSGLYTLLSVLDAERDLNEARRDLASARYEYILDSLRLKEAAGTLNVEDLAAINYWLE